MSDQVPGSKFPKPGAKRRGGRRPGAGAPRGNMNALKSGAYSKQFALLAAEPKVRDTLPAIGARAGRQQAKAEELAAFLLTNYARHVESVALAKAAGRTPRHGLRWLACMRRSLRTGWVVILQHLDQWQLSTSFM